MYKVQFLCGPPSFLDEYKNKTDTVDYCKRHKKHHTSVYGQHFYGGKGCWMERGYSEGCLKWGGGGH